MNWPFVIGLQQYASTAVAAYGDLYPGPLQQKLVDTGSQFTPSQSNSFLATFNLVHQQPNTFLNGFSATVFKESGGTHVLAIRGTEMEGWQIYQDLLEEDFYYIGVAGFAASQAVELYRYYRQLTTMPGELVQYSAVEVVQLLALKQFVAGTTSQVWTAAELLTDRGITPASGVTSAPVLAPTEKIVVTGHSLGGHLALLFARLFPQNTAEVISLNAPGIFHHGDLRLSMVGFSADPTVPITRIEAEGDGVSEIGSIWPGYTLNIAQESRSGPFAAINQNHSGVNGNDALSIMSTIAILDPTLAQETGVLSNYLRVSSNNAEGTYERALDGLREVLLGPGITPTPVPTEGSDATREDLYLNMHALLSAADAGGLRPQDGTIRVTQSSPTDLAARARSDFAAMSALIALSPLSVNASSPQSIGLLEGFQQSGWGQVFQ